MRGSLDGEFAYGGRGAGRGGGAQRVGRDQDAGEGSERGARQPKACVARFCVRHSGETLPIPLSTPPLAPPSPASHCSLQKEVTPKAAGAPPPPPPCPSAPGPRPARSKSQNYTNGGPDAAPRDPRGRRERHRPGPRPRESLGPAGPTAAAG